MHLTERGVNDSNANSIYICKFYNDYIIYTAPSLTSVEKPLIHIVVDG